MIYLINIKNIYRYRLSIELFETINVVEPCLILYHNSYKYLNKNLRIKTKFGFSNPDKFNQNKIEQNVVLNYNVESFSKNQIIDLIKYIEEGNKTMFLFLNKEIHTELFVQIMSYLEYDDVRHKEFKVNDNYEVFYKRLRRSFMINYITP